MEVPAGVGRPWVAYHGLVDTVGTHVGSMLAQPLFRDGVDSPPFETHLAAVSIDLPPRLEPGENAITAESLVGELTAGVKLEPSRSAERPVVIFHHGIGELPYDSTFDRLVRPLGDGIDATLVAIRAPYHHTGRALVDGTATLERFLAMQAVSVALIEAVRTRLVADSPVPVIVAGMSLGGVIANLHHSYLNTADRYVPMLAGLALDDVLLESVYRRGVDRRALDRAEHLERLLNFESAFAETDPAGVHPILARYDRIVRYPVQAPSYNGRPIVAIDAGHVTGAVTTDRLRTHLRRCIDRAVDTRGSSS